MHDGHCCTMELTTARAAGLYHFDTDFSRADVAKIDLRYTIRDALTERIHACNHSRKSRRIFFSAIACAAIFIAVLLTARTAKSQESPDNKDFLRRAFLKHEFSAKFFGPARWLNGGEAYTTV